MLWPNARLRPIENAELQQRLADACRQRPEAAGWLGLVEAALRESTRSKVWPAAVPRPAKDRTVRAPLLDRSRIRIDDRAVTRWIRRVVRLAAALDNGGAAALGRVNVRRLDALLLLEAAVSQDDARVDAIAAADGAAPHSLRVVAQMAALPLLPACGRALAGARHASSSDGYCTERGASTTLAAFRWP